MTAMADAAALMREPIAHRGLHDRVSGVIENSASAVAAAVAAGYGIEVDVQSAADGAAVVFHDDTLERLTPASGAVAARTVAELTAIPLTGSAGGDRIWRLESLLDLVDGRVPLVVELKSDWDGGRALADQVGPLLARYRGPVGAKSFDPRLIAALRTCAPGVPRGIIGCAFEAAEWPDLSRLNRWILRNLLHWPYSRPHFISWHVRDLSRTAVRLARRRGVPVMTWTVRTPADQAHAALGADQMVFEGFRP